MGSRVFFGSKPKRSSPSRFVRSGTESGLCLLGIPLIPSDAPPSHSPWNSPGMLSETAKKQIRIHTTGTERSERRKKSRGLNPSPKILQERLKLSRPETSFTQNPQPESFSYSAFNKLGRESPSLSVPFSRLGTRTEIYKPYSHGSPKHAANVHKLRNNIPSRSSSVQFFRDESIGNRESTEKVEEAKKESREQTQMNTAPSLVIEPNRSCLSSSSKRHSTSNVRSPDRETYWRSPPRHSQKVSWLHEDVHQDNKLHEVLQISPLKKGATVPTRPVTVADQVRRIYTL